MAQVGLDWMCWLAEKAPKICIFQFSRIKTIHFRWKILRNFLTYFLIDSWSDVLYIHEDWGRSYKAYIAVAVNVSIDLQIFDLHQGGTYLPKIPYCCNQSWQTLSGDNFWAGEAIWFLNVNWNRYLCKEPP